MAAKNERRNLQLHLNRSDSGEWVEALVQNGVRIPVGPICQLVPGMFHQHISSETLKSYIAVDENSSKELMKHIYPADIPVLVRAYTESVYTQVAESLNDFGIVAMEKIHPWIMNVLIDWDHFDNVICRNPKAEQVDDKHEPSGTEAEAPTITKDCPETDKQGLWTRPAVLSLISLHQKYEELFRKPGIKNKSVWSTISSHINSELELKVPFTEKQCEQKWKNITKSFRDTVDHNSKSGNEPKKCPFFKELEECYGYRPNVQPVYVASSIQTPKTSQRSLEIEDDTDKAYGPAVKRPKKRQNRKDAVIEILTDMREDMKSEQATLMATLAKQHEDRMANEKSRLNLFEKLITAITVKSNIQAKD